MSVVSLVKKTKAPDPKEIEMLEDTLRRAKAGEIRSLALTFIKEDDDVFTWVPGARDCFTMLGAITNLQHRFRLKALPADSES